MNVRRGRTGRTRAEIDAAGDCYERSKRFFEPDGQGLQSMVAKAPELSGAQGSFEPADEGRDLGHPKEVPALRASQAAAGVVSDARRAATAEAAGDDVVGVAPEAGAAPGGVRAAAADDGRGGAASPGAPGGAAAHDLQRACLLRYAGWRERMVLLGRLSLFGAGATRLHDRLLEVVADLGEGAEPVVVSAKAKEQTR